MPEIESLTEMNAEAVYEMCERSVAHHTVGRERFMREVLGHPALDPELALVARDGDAVAAFVFAVQGEKAKLGKCEERTIPPAKAATSNKR